jgi:RecA-family ATPase
MENLYEDISADVFESMFKKTKGEIQSGDSKKITEQLGLSWRELSSRQFNDVEKIIFGMYRGNVGTMFAVTNKGKTTMTLNIALSMAAGRTFYPFVKEHPGGRKVMFIDGESTLPELKADLELMMRDWSQSERELVEQNLHVVCDEEINDEPINLSEPEHLAAITEAAREFEPDLIIVDTLSALFTLRDENNNSEIKKVVMQPLKNLAREANAVVWMLHHIGKKNEDGKSTVGAYAGRGGSNIGGLSRVTANLTQDKMDAERVVFELTKAKGFRLKPVLMQLNHDSRWGCIPSIFTFRQFLLYIRPDDLPLI